MEFCLMFTHEFPLSGWTNDVLTQCAVGLQTVVISNMHEADEIITLECDKLNLVVSPESTLCCSDVKTQSLLWRGCWNWVSLLTCFVELVIWVWKRVGVPGVLWLS